ncbi:MAG TPA: histidine phosphatase family protein [Trebonia sp.]|nr:histidine phosphatase family protein [Trebonia sp.]
MSPRSPSTTATSPEPAARSVPSRQFPLAACLPALPSLWLVRHGESTWNLAGLAQGHNDEAELTERGLRQAAAAAAQFGYRPVRAIYSSDLRRARQTAAAFADVLGLPVYTDARLRERSLGVLEGRPHRDIGPAATGLADGLVVDPDTRPPGGESVRDLYLRAAAFCDDLAAALDGSSAVPGLADPGPDSPGPARAAGDVLVIAHGGTVRVLDAYARGVPVDRMTWPPLDNATVVRIPGKSAELRRLGRRSGR